MMHYPALSDRCMSNRREAMAMLASVYALPVAGQLGLVAGKVNCFSSVSSIS